MKIKATLIFLMVIMPLVSSAYIPRFWMIMSRTAENHGIGIYKVIQNVTFLHKSEPLILRETWIIKNGEKMRVTVSGLGPLKGKVNFTRVFSDHKKFFINSEGKTRFIKTNSDLLAPYFHFRYSKRIKPKLYAQNIIPAKGLSLPPAFSPPRKGEKRALVHDNDFLRLGRVNGLVTYAIGTPTSPDSSSPQPGIWIEQDQFNILKIRLKSLAEVTAQKYTKYGRGLKLARLREVSWDDNKVEIHTISVKPLFSSSKIRTLFTPKSLSDIKEPQLMLSKDDDPIISEFYKRFR